MPKKAKNIGPDVEKAAPDFTETMCIISQKSLQHVFSWLESDRMDMPYNEVRECQRLLLMAKEIEVKKPEDVS